MHSNTFEPNDDKPKVLKNNQWNIFMQRIAKPVECESCFDVISPTAGLIDRILNGRISKQIKIRNFSFDWFQYQLTFDGELF